MEKIPTWIAVREKWTDRQKNFRDCECWAPTIFQDVQTNDALKNKDISKIWNSQDAHVLNVSLGTEKVTFVWV